MKALITGGTGFVGRYLVRELISRGIACRLLVRPTSQTDWLTDIDNIELWQGDITEPDSLKGIAEGVDYVYHLAAVMGHVGAFSATKKDWAYFHKVNVVGTQNLADCFVEHHLKRFIFMSSTAAMGIIPDIVADEETALRPETPYQCSKAEAEQLLRDYFLNKRLPVIILRPSVFYGKGRVGDLFKLCRFVDRGFLPHIGWGDNLSPLVHVTDLVDACMACLDKGRVGEAYIITSARSFKMRELTNCVKTAMNAKPLEFTIPVSVAKTAVFFFECLYKFFRIKPIITMESVRGICADRRFSIAKAQRELAFSPKVDLEQCISEAVGWLREERKI